MSLEKALEENTIALREFTAMMRLACTASTVVAAVIEKPKAKFAVGTTVDLEALEKESAKISAYMAEQPDYIDTALGQRVTKTLLAQGHITEEEQALAFPKKAPEAKKHVAAAQPKVIEGALPVIDNAFETTLPEINFPEITLVDIGLAITAAAKVDRANVVAVLATFDVKTGSALRSDQYADFLAALK